MKLKSLIAANKKAQKKVKEFYQVKKAKAGAAAMSRQTHKRKTKFEDKKKAENKKKCRRKINYEE